jgi:hypothetical protein
MVALSFSVLLQCRSGRGDIKVLKVLDQFFFGRIGALPVSIAADALMVDCGKMAVLGVGCAPQCRKVIGVIVDTFNRIFMDQPACPQQCFVRGDRR